VNVEFLDLVLLMDGWIADCKVQKR
jgi:hypothetical protein